MGERVGAGVTSAAKEEVELVEITNALIARRRIRCFIDTSLHLFLPPYVLFTGQRMTFNFVRNL